MDLCFRLACFAIGLPLWCDTLDPPLAAVLLFGVLVMGIAFDFELAFFHAHGLHFFHSSLL